MGCKCAAQEYGNHTGLPVVAVDDVRTESDGRHSSQHGFAEENKAFGIPHNGIRVGLIAFEVVLVVDKIEVNALIDVFHDTYMNIFRMSAQIHIEMGDIAELTAVFPWNTGIAGDDHTDIIFLLVQTFRQCADYVCQTAGLDKGYTFRCGK